MELSKNNLKGLIEPIVYDGIKEGTYKVSECDSTELLTWNRLDLGFKLFYLDNLKKNNSLALEMYKSDIGCQTMGTYKELGNDEKNSFDVYVQEFKKTYNSIKENGFDKNKTILPVTDSMSIINGAHRLASAIHLNKSISYVRLNTADMICDYNNYYKKNIPSEHIENAVNTFLKYSSNCYIAFLWPSGKKNEKKSISKFSEVIYQKELTLTPTGAENLLIELYKHMDWVGAEQNGYPGVKKKLIECFPIFQPFTVIAFQSSDLHKVREIKEAVREVNGIGFSSVHITDTKQEAIDISNLIFNSNGLHFLNYARPYKYVTEHTKLSLFKEFLIKNKLNFDEALIDGGLSLSLYGLRKSNDIDFFVSDSSRIKVLSKDIDEHDSELKYHLVEKEELIFNPKYHFIYNGLKIVSFEQLYKMKINRNDKKDNNDCRVMNSLIINNGFLKKINDLRQIFFYTRIKVIYFFISPIMQLLRNVGLYYKVREIYRKIKNNQL